jgi:exonuclease SbcC
MQTLIIDERISGLDEDGINRFAEIIDVIRLRYKRCIVITHITQLKDLFDRQMLVSNTEDGSIIE